MIVLQDLTPLSPEAKEMAVRIARELIAEHDGPYSDRWREEKERRVARAEADPKATLQDVAGWMDWSHRYKFLIRVGEEPNTEAYRELEGSFYLRPDG